MKNPMAGGYEGRAYTRQVLSGVRKAMAGLIFGCDVNFDFNFDFVSGPTHHIIGMRGQSQV
jgi:hypothetical protein